MNIRYPLYEGVYRILTPQRRCLGKRAAGTLFLRWCRPQRPGYKSTRRWFPFIPFPFLLYFAKAGPPFLYKQPLSALYRLPPLYPLPAGHPSFSICFDAFPDSSAAFAGWVLQDAKVGCRAWYAVLKCISCKILPYCVRVIWQEKPSYEAVPTAGYRISKIPKRFRQERTE